MRKSIITAYYSIEQEITSIIYHRDTGYNLFSIIYHRDAGYNLSSIIYHRDTGYNLSSIIYHRDTEYNLSSIIYHRYAEYNLSSIIYHRDAGPDMIYLALFTTGIQKKFYCLIHLPFIKDFRVTGKIINNLYAAE